MIPPIYGCVLTLALFEVSLFHITNFVALLYNSHCLLVGRKLFGDGYSGLEYDYRGLMHLYKSTGQLKTVL